MKYGKKRGEAVLTAGCRGAVEPIGGSSYENPAELAWKKRISGYPAG
jgi:hypothetical protein